MERKQVVEGMAGIAKQVILNAVEQCDVTGRELQRREFRKNGELNVVIAAGLIRRTVFTRPPIRPTCRYIPLYR